MPPAAADLATLLRRGVFGAQLASTLAMFGLIWFVQLVHYPLFLRADPHTFAAFEAEHATRTGWIAAPLMVTELLSSLCLLRGSLRPESVSRNEALLGLALVAVLWGSTVFLQIPLHNQLHRGYDRPAIQRLVAGNWVRTIAWTLRAILITLWAARLVRPA